MTYIIYMCFTIHKFNSIVPNLSTPKYEIFS